MLGKHIILDLYDCDRKLLDDVEFCKYILTEAANAADCKILNTYFHKFEPQGLTGIIAVCESHFSIHTYPEHGYAAIDVFCCKDKLGASVDLLKTAFKSKKSQINEIARGEEDYISQT